MRTHRFELVHRIDRRLRPVRPSVGASTVRARGCATVRRGARASEEFTEHVDGVTVRRGVQIPSMFKGATWAPSGTTSYKSSKVGWVDHHGTLGVERLVVVVCVIECVLKEN
jgi:hypothetical protein